MWQLLLLLYFESVFAEDCPDGVQTFSRVSGHQVDQEVLKKTGVLLNEAREGITFDCLRLCKEQPDCSSFSLDYAKITCNSFPSSSLTSLKQKSGFSYFEKNCYQNITQEQVQQQCGEKIWTFDIFVGASLDLGFSSRTLETETRQECERLCILEEEFQCKSANFNKTSGQCSLFKETLRSQPQAFRSGLESSNFYLVNQCVPSRPSPCRYQKKSGTKVLTPDILIYAKDENDCQSKCNSISGFICRSYSLQGMKCFLSGDDSFTSASSDLPSESDSVHGEVVCPSDDCVRGTWTYERSPSHSLLDSDQSPFEDESAVMDNSASCRSGCDRKGFLCPAFIVDHRGDGMCYNLDRNSQGRSSQLTPTKHATYFEKVCLNISSTCKSKLWSFTRIPGFQLDDALYSKTIDFVSSRRDCEQHCINTNCSSALYNEISISCKLSNDSRTTAAKSFKKNFNQRISYLENNCFSQNNRTCPFKGKLKNALTLIKDLVIANVSSDDLCKESCLNNNKFDCLSYSYNSDDGRCFVSSESTQTMKFNSITSVSGNWTYREIQCDETSEIITSTTTQKPSTLPVTPPTKLPVTMSSTTTAVPTQPSQDTQVTESQTDNTNEASNEVTSQVTEATSHSSPIVQISNNSFCRADQVVTFERIPGFEPFGNFYFTRLCFGQVGNPGIVKSCRMLCLEHGSCRGFVIDYSRRQCFGVIAMAEIPRSSLIVSEEKDFFLAVCQHKSVSCNKLWTFERIIDQTVVGASPRFILPFISRWACQCLCLEEKQFSCRSIVHEAKNSVCKMYDKNRASDAFSGFSLVFSHGSEYLENTCGDMSHRVCRYTVHKDDVTIQSLIHSTQVTSISECRRACDSESSFSCQSFSFVDRMLYSSSSRNLCLLSSDNESTARAGSLRYSPRSFFYQRDCRR